MKHGERSKKKTLARLDKNYSPRPWSCNSSLNSENCFDNAITIKLKQMKGEFRVVLVYSVIYSLLRPCMRFLPSSFSFVHCALRAFSLSPSFIHAHFAFHRCTRFTGLLCWLDWVGQRPIDAFVVNVFPPLSACSFSPHRIWLNRLDPVGEQWEEDETIFNQFHQLAIWC